MKEPTDMEILRAWQIKFTRQSYSSMECGEVGLESSEGDRHEGTNQYGDTPCVDNKVHVRPNILKYKNPGKSHSLENIF